MFSRHLFIRPVCKLAVYSTRCEKNYFVLGDILSTYLGFNIWVCYRLVKRSGKKSYVVSDVYMVILSSLWTAEKLVVHTDHTESSERIESWRHRSRPVQCSRSIGVPSVCGPPSTWHRCRRESPAHRTQKYWDKCCREVIRCWTPQRSRSDCKFPYITHSAYSICYYQQWVV